MAGRVNKVFCNSFGGAPPAPVGSSYLIRRPRSEIRRKAEGISTTACVLLQISDFGLPSDLGFRASDFALQAQQDTRSTIFELGTQPPPRLLFGS